MYGFRIVVDGAYACYTRPEMKVERVSYDVPTPSALIGMLKSVYWKPAIRYVIDKIIVFHPIQFINVRRNEVKEKAKKPQMKSLDKDLAIYTNECRNQRASLLLKDVKYGIEFHFELTGIQSDKADESEEKHYNILKRRLEHGQCFRTPCLGCSEFPAAHLELVEQFKLEEISSEILQMGDVDLGYMLLAMKFKDGGIPLNKNWDTPVFSDCAEAVFYRPHMIGGVIDVKKYAEGLLC